MPNFGSAQLAGDRPAFVAQLKALCVKEVAQAFDKKTLQDVPEQYHGHIVELLPLDLPLEMAGLSITDEQYWQRRSQARWATCSTVQHGMSYKQLYFELNLQEALEEFDMGRDDLDQLKRLLAFSALFVQGLRISQLPSHVDLDILFDGLGNSLTSLALEYGRRNMGMEYDRSLLGMQLSDCRALAGCLECAESLTHLDLSNNVLDDDKSRMLASGLVNNLTVVHLDLSHNRIGDRGTRALAKLLHRRSVIAVLSLANNQIRAEGGRALARALRNNTSLCHLNLRLNRLGDDGGRAVLDVLRAHPSLEHLNVSSNALGEACAASLAKLLTLNTVMREVDMSCNEFGGGAGAVIRGGLDGNEGLEVLDVRLSGVEESEAVAIADALRLRAETRARRSILRKP